MASRAAGQLTEAVGHLEGALEQRPSYADAILDLAVVLRELGRDDASRRRYAQLLRFRSDAIVAEGHLGLAQLDAAAHPDRALEHAERAYATYRETGSPLLRDGAVVLGLLLARRDCARAVGVLRVALPVADRAPVVHAYLGACLQQLGRTGEAGPHLDAAAAAGQAVPDLSSEGAQPSAPADRGQGDQ